MGFWGISHWVESDGAADFRHVLLGALEQKTEAARTKAVRKVISAELKDEANNYNTPGFVNIALCLEVEGHDKGYDEALPVFSQLLTAKQLKTISSALIKAQTEWEPEWEHRLGKLQKLVAAKLPKGKK